MTIVTNMPITLALAKFEDIVNRGLASLIDGDPHLRLVASDIPHAELARALSAHAPDVAILNFAALSSPSDLRDLHARCPQTRLMVLADRPSIAQCRQMIGFGATACLTKDAEERDLLHAVYLASRGLHVLPSTSRAPNERARPTPLTPREADVLELLASGISNAEIAAALSVGIETVRTHASSIYRKLGVSTRRELRAIS
jgi:DNA-binding NarL/FixJ family response regulator